MGHGLKQFARNALRIEGEIYRPPGFCLEIWGKDNAAEFGVERKLHIFFRGNKHEPHANNVSMRLREKPFISSL